MLIFMTFFMALLCGALGGLLYHLQQPALERDANNIQDISWPRQRKSNEPDNQYSRYHLGVLGDCLYGAVGGLLLLAILSRLIGDFVSPIFSPGLAVERGDVFTAWLYLAATAVLGGYLGLRLLRIATASSFVQWKRQLDQVQENLRILEEELRESRSSLLVREGRDKLAEGFYAEARSCFEAALALTPTRARILGCLGYCKSYLAQQDNRVEGQEHVTLDQALQDLNDGIRLVEDQIDRQPEQPAVGALYYNRACIQYLKWLSQGRSPARLEDPEINVLRSDIERSLRHDPAQKIWQALLKDCGLAAGDWKNRSPSQKGDLQDLYEQSGSFRAFVQSLREDREPQPEATPFTRMAVGATEMEGIGY